MTSQGLISVSADEGEQGGVMAPSAESVQTGDTLSAADCMQNDVVTSSALGVTADISVSADEGEQGGVMAPSAENAQPYDTLSAADDAQPENTLSAVDDAKPDNTLSAADDAKPDNTLSAADHVQPDDTLSADNGWQGGVMAPSPESVWSGVTLSAANDTQYYGVTTSAVRAQHDETLSAADGVHADIIYSAAETKPCDVITSHTDIARGNVSVSDDAGVRDGSMTSFGSECVPIKLTHLIINVNSASAPFLNNTDLNIIQCRVAGLCDVSLMTFCDDVMLPCNLDALPVIQTHSKIDKLHVNDYDLFHNHMLLLCKWNHSNPHIVQVIDNLSCLTDRKKRNRWVSSVNQDGQAAVITPDQDGQDVVMSHDQDGQDVVIITQDDDEQSRPIHKVQRARCTPWTELLYTDGTSMGSRPTKSGVAITSSSITTNCS